MAVSPAYLLVSHGSRDPRPQLAMENLAQQVAQALADRLDAPVPLLVETAVLELGLPLHQQIQNLAARAAQAGHRSLKLLPMFLLSGVHVMEDIPAEVALAQLDEQMQIQVCPHLGTHPQLWTLLRRDLPQASKTQFGKTQVSKIQSGKIIISHGSRRPGGQQAVEQIAAQLGAIPAYWSVPPDLETQVVKLVEQGVQQIEVLPYFLFEGGITDAIAQKVEQLQQQFSDIPIQLNAPMGHRPETVDLILDLLAPAER